MGKVDLKTLYQIIYQTQTKLHCEYAMSSKVDEFLNKNFLQDFNQDYINELIQEKHYYTRLLFIISLENGTKLPISNPNSLYNLKTGFLTQTIPSIFNSNAENPTNIINTILNLDQNNLLNSVILDIFTFSVIPSIYLMFVETNALNSFCELILMIKTEKNIINKNLHFILARSLFLSPMFLQFINQTFQSLFTNTLNSSKEELKNRVIQLFESNIQLIPSYAQIFFRKMNDTYNFLNESLFKTLFEKPCLFFWSDIEFDSSNEKSEILREVFDESTILSIAKIIDDNLDSISVESHFSSFISSGIKTETGMKIISTVDKLLFSIVNDRLSSEKVDLNLSQILQDKEYEIFKAFFEGETASDSFDSLQKSSMPQGTDECWIHFRAILKLSQPFPANFPVSEDANYTRDSFVAMVKKLALTDCDLTMYIQIGDLYDKFESSFMSWGGDIESADEFEKMMNTMITQHKEQEYAQKQISLHKKKFGELVNKKKKPIESILDLFCNFFYDAYTDLIGENQIREPRDTSEIVRDPSKYDEMCSRYLKQQEPIVAKYMRGGITYNGLSDRVFFRRFYGRLTFCTFLASRTDLSIYDKVAKECCYRYFASLANQESTKSVDRAMAHSELLVKELLWLRQVFEDNTTIYKKEEDFMSVSAAINNKGYRLFHLYGQDDFLPFWIFLIAASRPERIVSNIVYLLEFKDNLPMDVFNIILAVTHIVQSRKSLFPFDSFYFLTRSKSKKCEIFFSGNSPEFIVRAFNAFAEAANDPSKKEMTDAQTNKLIAEIAQNDGQKFHYSNCFDLLKTRIGFFCRSDIYLGTNLTLECQQKKNYHSRIAVFAFKNTNGANLTKCPNCIKNFINDNKLQNTNKIVLLDSEDSVTENFVQNVAVRTDLDLLVYKIERMIRES